MSILRKIRSQTGDHRFKRLGFLHLILLIPMSLIAGFAAAGQAGVTTSALACAFLVLFLLPPQGNARSNRSQYGQMDRTEIVEQARKYLGQSLYSIGVFTIEIDRVKSLTERIEFTGVDALLGQCGLRLSAILGPDDHIARLDRASFAVLVGPDSRLDLEAALQFSTRLQAALAGPFAVGGTTVQLTASIGFSLSNRMDAPTAPQLFQASLAALIEAQRCGPAAVRSFSDTMQHRIDTRKSLVDDVHNAFTDKQIQAYFQPQVSTQTGDITGFETLARWHHPAHGTVPPNDFLPAFHDAGAMDRLGQHMIDQALGALRMWQDAGVIIPRIGVNFSSVELSHPDLIGMITEKLAKHDIGADRLGIEVLETVVANQVSGTVIENLATLAKMGCGIDLDDFGTGHASITSIRRFSIERIKIDRSFVTCIDEDPEQQDMVIAILTMAERLGLDALAEGVETRSEQAMLTQLGCAHVQGFGIAHPMPLSQTLEWIHAHHARRTDPIRLAGNGG